MTEREPINAVILLIIGLVFLACIIYLIMNIKITSTLFQGLSAIASAASSIAVIFGLRGIVS